LSFLFAKIKLQNDLIFLLSLFKLEINLSEISFSFRSSVLKTSPRTEISSSSKSNINFSIISWSEFCTRSGIIDIFLFLSLELSIFKIEFFTLGNFTYFIIYASNYGFQSKILDLNYSLNFLFACRPNKETLYSSARNQ
jgi:hypothetical protein